MRTETLQTPVSKEEEYPTCVGTDDISNSNSTDSMHVNQGTQVQTNQLSRGLQIIPDVCTQICQTERNTNSHLIQCTIRENTKPICTQTGIPMQHCSGQTERIPEKQVYYCGNDTVFHQLFDNHVFDLFLEHLQESNQIDDFINIVQGIAYGKLPNNNLAWKSALYCFNWPCVPPHIAYTGIEITSNSA